MDIQPPYCTILFVEYNTYEQVHFNDLKILSRDQQFVSFYYGCYFISKTK